MDYVVVRIFSQLDYSVVQIIDIYIHLYYYCAVQQLKCVNCIHIQFNLLCYVYMLVYVIQSSIDRI